MEQCFRDDLKFYCLHYQCRRLLSSTLPWGWRSCPPTKRQLTDYTAPQLRTHLHSRLRVNLNTRIMFNVRSVAIFVLHEALRATYVVNYTCWYRYTRKPTHSGEIINLLSSCIADISCCYHRLEGILTMVYVVQNSQNFSGLFPSSCIPKNTTFRKLDLFPSSGEGGGEDTYSVGPLRES
jgi:hypothetical protein